MVRVKLLISLCDAVQYAHQNLIVHRDLKPSNVLVGASGQPKLLDFGVAKILDDANQTESRAPLTFAYAAPEQIRGDAITTATDVYALGVILYELLTGERPHKAFNKPGGGDGSLSMLQAITDTDATAPSYVVSLRTNTSTGIKPNQLKGDLDTIVLKALSRNPARRYLSAQAMAQDLDAYVRQMPIRARPETWRYRAGKFVRRHTVGVGLGALAFALVAGLSIVSVIQAQRAQRQQHLAEAQAQRATAVQDFLIQLFEQQRPDATRGASISAKDLLDRAESQLRQNAGLSDDANLDTSAALLKTLSQLRFDLGDSAAALALGNQAVTLAEKRFGADSVPHALTLIERSFSVNDAGQPSAALADCHRALPILRAAYDIQAQTITHADFFNALCNCASLARDNGALDEAAALLKDATSVHASSKPTLKREYRLFSERGRLAIAREEFQTGAAIYTDYINALRADPMAAPSDLSSALHSRATSKKNLGQTRSAIADYREALAIQQRIFGTEHVLVIESMSSLASELYNVGDATEALSMGNQALSLARTSLSPDSPSLGYLLTDAAIAANRRQDIAGATALMKEAVDANARAFGGSHPDTLRMICNVSSLQRKAGQFDDARTSAQSVLARVTEAHIAPSASGPWHEAQFRLALIADRVGDAKAQLAHANAMLQALPADAAADELPKALSQQATALVRLGQTKAALASNATLEKTVRERFEAGTSQRAEYLAYAAWVYMESNDPARAQALSAEFFGKAPAASIGGFDSLLAAMVQLRALRALGQTTAAQPWAAALRERNKSALPEEARYWQAIQAAIAE